MKNFHFHIVRNNGDRVQVTVPGTNGSDAARTLRDGLYPGERIVGWA